MPPFHIDGQELFAAIVRLANENDRSWRFTRKGDSRPWQDVEAQKASRRRTIAAKRKAAADRAELRRKERAALRRPPPGQGIADRMLRAMEPGQWYGRGDLIKAAGAERSARGKVQQNLLRRGMVERVRNPAFVPDAEAVSPWAVMGGAEVEPEWLYRLTERGEAFRVRLLAG